MQLSLGDAIKKVFESSKWNSRLAGIKISMDWEKIMGKTISNYTKSIELKFGTLYVSTDVPILKHEFITNKEQLLKKINEFYGSEVVKDLKVK